MKVAIYGYELCTSYKNIGEFVRESEFKVDEVVLLQKPMSINSAEKWGRKYGVPITYFPKNTSYQRKMCDYVDGIIFIRLRRSKHAYYVKLLKELRSWEVPIFIGEK